jgi:hypothetical protein
MEKTTQHKLAPVRVGDSGRAEQRDRQGGGVCGGRGVGK